jgi:hypothetical protein
MHFWRDHYEVGHLLEEDANYISSFSHANLTLEGDHDDVNEMLTATAGGNYYEPRPRGRAVINDKRSKQRGTAPGLRETLT